MANFMLRSLLRAGGDARGGSYGARKAAQPLAAATEAAQEPGETAGAASDSAEAREGAGAPSEATETKLGTPVGLAVGMPFGMPIAGNPAPAVGLVRTDVGFPSASLFLREYSPPYSAPWSEYRLGSSGYVKGWGGLGGTISLPEYPSVLDMLSLPAFHRNP